MYIASFIEPPKKHYSKDMKKIVFLLIASISLAISVYAQDVHFTQFFTSPLTLNPAQTGLVPGDLRLAANYRTQWNSVSSKPYSTMTMSYDMAILKGKLPEGDAIGLGVMALLDQAGTALLQNKTFGGSFAYHKGFGLDRKQHLSLGAQVFIVQKTLDKTALKFGQGYDPNTGTYTAGNSGEATGLAADLTYPDFNLGVMYSGEINEHVNVYSGLSYYHLTQPVESFLGDNHQIHSRITAYLGGSFNLNEKTVLYASSLYQTQASATEILLGAAMGWVMNPGHDLDYQRNTVFYLGGWYRYGDAIAPYVAVEWSKMRIGLSYDINSSKFSPATNGNGGLELSLLFFGNINRRAAEPNYSWSCPKLF
ncbi:MAG: type IX secretion system membrane protein PorP/SprF [Chitinophagia bacterium]|nr:type IX secretion system membrane protein PorP/SprF [Chitinophagia bacterium]